MSENSSQRTELAQVAADLNQQMNNIEPPTKLDNQLHRAINKIRQPPSSKNIIRLKRRSRSKDHHSRHTKKKKAAKKVVRFELAKCKFTRRVDDDFVMEYRLRPEDIMKYRKNHFHVFKEPRIEVRATKTSELKEEFGNYCGVKKSIKNWLYWV